MDNKVAEFMDYCARLETMEFVGLAKILKVELASEEDNEVPRPFEEILQDMLKAYANSNRKRRRELLKILKSITKGRDYYHMETKVLEDSGADQEELRATPEEE